MAKNGHKMAIYEFYISSFFFLTKLKIKGRENFLIYVIAFDPIRILTRLALKNDRQNLSFVKPTYGWKCL
jgi:hypothetical protein